MLDLAGSITISLVCWWQAKIDFIEKRQEVKLLEKRGVFDSRQADLEIKRLEYWLERRGEK